MLFGSQKWWPLHELSPGEANRGKDPTTVASVEILFLRSKKSCRSVLILWFVCLAIGFTVSWRWDDRNNSAADIRRKLRRDMWLNQWHEIISTEKGDFLLIIITIFSNLCCRPISLYGWWSERYSHFSKARCSLNRQKSLCLLVYFSCFFLYRWIACMFIGLQIICSTGIEFAENPQEELVEFMQIIKSHRRVKRTCSPYVLLAIDWCHPADLLGRCR